MRGRFLTTGERVSRFEADLARFAGRKRAVGVTSGTAGLHLALVGLGVGEGDEVITTPISFVATANAVVLAGARPVFAEVEASTGNIDPAAVESAITEKTRAILPVHLYGVMCDMGRLAEVARRNGLLLIEDAAHALEALQRRGAGVAVNYRPIHLYRFYRENFGGREGRFPRAEHIGASTISLPLYPKLTEEEADYVAASLAESMKE